MTKIDPKTFPFQVYHVKKYDFKTPKKEMNIVPGKSCLTPGVYKMKKNDFSNLNFKIVFVHQAVDADV